LKLFYFPITEMQQYLGIHEYLQYFYTHKNHGIKIHVYLFQARKLHANNQFIVYFQQVYTVSMKTIGKISMTN